MKLQAIKAICTSVDQFVIINTEDHTQWIGNGITFYPVEGIYITKEGIPALFDLTTKQAEEIQIREINATDPAWQQEQMGSAEERLCHQEAGGQFVWDKGTLYRVLTGPDGTILINESFMKPARNKDDEYNFFVRHMQDGGSVISVYGDMFASALIMPISGTGVAKIMCRIGTLAQEPIQRTAHTEGKGSYNAQQMLEEDAL